jgi:hypothetical protein
LPDKGAETALFKHMRKLPIGIQSFSDLRSRDYLYVDKTQHIYNLINKGKIFFFSRPRRFGKSLLVSTLEALFKGEKELFEGLYIYDKADWNETYPVIKFDWSCIRHTSETEMEKGVSIFLKQIADEYGLVLEQEYSANRFDELLRRVHRKTGRQVVVLVDEYDIPILDALQEPSEEIDSLRKFLQSFYRVLKAADEHLRFVFLTGVSKFSKLSIFSGLNNPNDITLDPSYATICGYTQDELESYFTQYLKTFARSETEKGNIRDLLDQIRFWYNGFSWDGVTSLYNPYSTLLLMDKKIFRNYWFETGTPTFLVGLIKERNEVTLLMEPCRLQDTEFNSFDYLTLDTKLLMFQTGYLTIRNVEKDPFGGGMIYTLGVPNEEVRQSMMQYLTSSFAVYPVESTATMRSRMQGQLFSGDVSAFATSLRELFAHIPYQLHIHEEAYYHSLVLVWLNLLGFKIQAEVSTDKGRIDAVWTWKDRVIIAEIKYSSKRRTSSLIKAAFAQIHKNRYYDRYRSSAKQIALLAVAFAGRDISCSLEELQTE